MLSKFNLTEKKVSHPWVRTENDFACERHVALLFKKKGKKTLMAYRHIISNVRTRNPEYNVTTIVKAVNQLCVDQYLAFVWEGGARQQKYFYIK